MRSPPRNLPNEDLPDNSQGWALPQHTVRAQDIGGASGFALGWLLGLGVAPSDTLLSGRVGHGTNSYDSCN